MLILFFTKILFSFVYFHKIYLIIHYIVLFIFIVSSLFIHFINLNISDVMFLVCFCMRMSCHPLGIVLF